MEDGESLDKKIQKLKTNRAAGPDGIYPRALKSLGMSSLSHWQVFYVQHKLPDDWRQGNIIPV